MPLSQQQQTIRDDARARIALRRRWARLNLGASETFLATLPPHGPEDQQPRAIPTLHHSTLTSRELPHPGSHPYCPNIETLTVGIFPIDPAWSPGETYAFIVNVNGRSGYAVDAEDAITLARSMFDEDDLCTGCRDISGVVSHDGDTCPIHEDRSLLR